MGFLVITLIFVLTGVLASILVRLCVNRGPSTNLFVWMLHLTLVITATVCCWLMWAIVYLAQMKPLIVPILSEGE
ncbi:putative ATPase, V0 complex, subunit e1/e2 [Dioscorea sansibarensis]